MWRRTESPPPEMPCCPRGQRESDELRKIVDVDETRMALITFGQHRTRERPFDPDVRVVPRDADLAVGVVDVAALVFHLGDGTDDRESVRKPFRNVALPEVLGRERNAHPFAEHRRAAPHVHCNVEDFSLDDTNELALRMPALKMEAPDRAGGRPRVIVLHEHVADTASAIFLRVIRLEKKTTDVDVNVRLDDDDVGNGGANKPHVRTPAR